MMLRPSKLLVSLGRKPRCQLGLILKASICHKSELPPPSRFVGKFPYEKYQYTILSMWLDPFTKNKMNENSKIISVEGNVACGKDDFARRLADQLGMLYLPMVDLDSYYINDRGFDYRGLNPLLPERLRMCDWEMFHEDPTRHSALHMQFYLLKLRLGQYLKALRHLLNTGQGVVINRSVFNERVFVEAMHNIGWLPRGYLRADGVRFYDFRSHYDHLRNVALNELPKPHLTLYLKTPVETCLKRIKSSSDPVISDSKALVPEFLESIEKAYSDVALPKAENYSHVVEYDYPERMSDEEIGDVIYDLSQMDFEFDHRDTRFEFWEELDRFTMSKLRLRYSSLGGNYQHIRALCQNNWDIAGLGDSISQIDLILRDALYEAHVKNIMGDRILDVDEKIQSPLKSLYDFPSFEEKLRRAIYSEFP